MSYKRSHKISLNLGLIIQHFFIQWWLKLETQGLYSVQIWHVKKRKSIEINRSSVQQFSAGYVRNQSLNFWFLGQKLNFNAFPAEKLHLRAAFRRARVDFFWVERFLGRQLYKSPLINKQYTVLLNLQRSQGLRSRHLCCMKLEVSAPVSRSNLSSSLTFSILHYLPPTDRESDSWIYNWVLKLRGMLEKEKKGKFSGVQ